MKRISVFITFVQKYWTIRNQKTCKHLQNSIEYQVEVNDTYNKRTVHQAICMKGIFCLQIRKEGKSGRRTNVLNKKNIRITAYRHKGKDLF